MGFKLFKKKSKGIGLMGKSDVDTPPISPMEEESVELPTFPSAEEVKSSKPKEKDTSAVEKLEMGAVKGVEEELGERDDLELVRPIFIEAKLYRGVMDDVGVLKTVLKNNTESLTKIGDLKDDRERNYNKWHKQIEDIQRKLIYADNVLFGKK